VFEYPEFDPIAIQIGPVAVRWYGLMYVVGFAVAWWLARRRATRSWAPVDRPQVDDLIFYGALGVVLGGRIGYMLFYDIGRLFSDPVSFFKVWQGGMSFHGGLIGVLIAMWLYARKLDRGFFELTDFIAPLVPIGLGLGRIGNFINGELWGKQVSPEFPLSVVYRGVSRHPSQLYEAFLEGFVLFVVLWAYSARPRPVRAVSGLFLLGYGTFRFLVEFVRLPDLDASGDLKYLAWGWLTTGQLLSAPMIVFGVLLLWLAYRRQDRPRGAAA
jgi:phosphatidylglycerol:prolipoprotein diacylglycerol transferase